MRRRVCVPSERVSRFLSNPRTMTTQETVFSIHTDFDLDLDTVPSVLKSHRSGFSASRCASATDHGNVEVVQPMCVPVAQIVAIPVPQWEIDVAVSTQRQVPAVLRDSWRVLRTVHPQSLWHRVR